MRSSSRVDVRRTIIARTTECRVAAMNDHPAMDTGAVPPMTTSHAIVYIARLGVGITHDEDAQIVQVDVAALLELLGAPSPN
jgi:hypothetical protein